MMLLSMNYSAFYNVFLRKSAIFSILKSLYDTMEHITPILVMTAIIMLVCL